MYIGCVIFGIQLCGFMGLYICIQQVANIPFVKRTLSVSVLIMIHSVQTFIFPTKYKSLMEIHRDTDKNEFNHVKKINVLIYMNLFNKISGLVERFFFPMVRHSVLQRMMHEFHFHNRRTDLWFYICVRNCVWIWVKETMPMDNVPEKGKQKYNCFSQSCTDFTRGLECSKKKSTPVYSVNSSVINLKKLKTQLSPALK